LAGSRDGKSENQQEQGWAKLSSVHNITSPLASKYTVNYGESNDVADTP
jgi:hypothetical protein